MVLLLDGSTLIWNMLKYIQVQTCNTVLEISFANCSGNFSVTEKEDMSVSKSVSVGSPLGFEERTL